MGLLFFDANRNAALTLLIFGTFLIAQGGAIFLRHTRRVRFAQIMIGAGVLSILIAGVVFVFGK